MNNAMRLVPHPAAHVFGDFSSLVDNLLLPLSGATTKSAAALAPAMDVVEKDDGYEVQVELPGVKKENVNISLQEGVLTINAQNREEKVDKQEQRVISRERHSGEFIRSLRFGSVIDEGGIEARFSDGILHLHLPKAEEAQPRRIAVKSG